MCASTGSPESRDAGFASTPQPKRTRGFKRPPTLAASAPARSGGFRLMPELRMDVDALRRQIEADVAAGDVPCIVVGTAGSVSTGAVDPLPEIAALCKEYGVWFHVDGAYGGFAAALPDAPDDLHGLSAGRFCRGRSAQVALCAARGRMRAGPRSGRAARRLRVSPALLSFRRARDKLCRLRPAELARLPCPQSVAGPEARWSRGLPQDDCGRYPLVSGDG